MLTKNLRKIGISLLSVIIFALSCTTVIATSNNADDMTIIDATFVQKIIVGYETITNEYINKYDYDNDGKLSVIDVTLIQKCLTNELKSPDFNAEAATKIYKYFSKRGLNDAAICGILGNIKQECNFDEKYYFAEYADDSISFTGNFGGIAMWYGDSFTHFTKDCPEWKTSVDAQIEYLYQTLIKDGQGSPSDKYYFYCTGCWCKLKSVPNTREGAIQAARIFRDNYERPAEGLEGPREEYALYFWNEIY